MGIIEEINDFMESINRDESFASILKSVFDLQLKDQSFPKDYYSVTHLVNPIQTFFSRLHPEVKKTPELARKLARGKQLHNFAISWFKALPNFVEEEGTIDGAWVGLTGVRGRIDYRMGDSILEFKTKDNPPSTIQEILLQYPQDLEQLAFYSIIHPSNPKINYLIFMRNSHPFDFKVYKIMIKDSSVIKSILKSRIGNLDRAFERNDPSNLGRCRYFGSGCQFSISGHCSCASFDPINIDALQRSLEIIADDDFVRQLEEARNSCRESSTFSITTRDVVAPRKHYMGVVTGLESPYRSDELDEYKACMWVSMNVMKKIHDIDLNSAERQSINESKREPRLRIGFRWLKLRSSVHPDGEILPYILNINVSSPTPLRSPSPYHIAELGTICATYGKNNGLIIRVYPNLRKIVQVFRITFRNKEQILSIVNNAIDHVENAEKNSDLLSLPPCPPFMNDSGDCPLMEECNSREGEGCVS